MNKNLIKTIQNTIFQQGLFAREAKIVVGVSGGADSTCLLNVLAKLAPKYNLQLIIAHINYGLRGKDSDGDEKFVRGLAEKNGLKFEVLNVRKTNNSKVEPLNSRKESPRFNLGSVTVLNAEPHPSAAVGTFSLSAGQADLTKKKGIKKFPSENKLRNIRYEFFEKIRAENKFDLIAVAHNSDDQVETFLMRVLRGAGLQGLSAMKYKNGNIIRPLLNISRKEILAYLAKINITYRTDKTNFESLFLRNKIRNKLLPYLEKNYNPNIRKTIFNSTASIADDYSFINSFAEKIYAKNKNLSVKKLLSLHPAIQKRILLLAIAEKKSDTKDIEMPHIEEILKAITSAKGKNQSVVFQGLKMTRKGDKITISKL